MAVQNQLILFLLIKFIEIVNSKPMYLDDICSRINNQRIYLDYGESGTLVAFYNNNVSNRRQENRNVSQHRCSIELVTCSWCVIYINFRLLNIPRHCGNSKIYGTCGCDYLWIYEPSFENASGEQFCGRFIFNNVSRLDYRSQTKRVAITFFYNKAYDHAFKLDYYSQRNRKILNGFPRYNNINNSSQIISSPFFPSYYPKDLNIEHIVKCNSPLTCRVNLIFTDFLIHESSVMEIFDSDNQRILVTTGNIFRPPVITSSGPHLTIRFYANGEANLGFKAYYSFILGDFNETQFKPDLDCGGLVHNLGGGITMMEMVAVGSKFYDCVWIIRPPSIYFRLKTHLYIKIIAFSNFGGSLEIIIRQGLTSDGPVLESVKLPPAHFYVMKQKEHVVPVSQGFYVSLRGLFRPDSQLIITYAAFNYKNCYTGSDFLCQNLRCISSLLSCDGFDHCGDSSDESMEVCSKGSKDRRSWSKIPNFLFPKVDNYSDLTAVTLVFLMCSFGLIFVVIILLYRINIRARQQRQIQTHIETIHAILEEGVVGLEEEVVITDDPPDYEPPPEYDDVVKAAETKTVCNNLAIFNRLRRCSRCHPHKSISETNASHQDTNRTTHIPSARQIPDSPPPAYNDNLNHENPGPSGIVQQGQGQNNGFRQKKINYKPKLIMKTARRFIGCKKAGLWRNFSDSELVCSFKFDDDAQIPMNLNKSLSSDNLLVRDC